MFSDRVHCVHASTWSYGIEERRKKNRTIRRIGSKCNTLDSDNLAWQIELNRGENLYSFSQLKQ